MRRSKSKINLAEQIGYKDLDLVNQDHKNFDPENQSRKVRDQRNRDYKNQSSSGRNSGFSN